MARSRAESEYICQACAATFPRWEGQCRSCGTWNSLVETLIRPAERRARPRSGAFPTTAEPHPLGALAASATTRRPSGLAEVDRVLGGGLVPGTVLL